MRNSSVQAGDTTLQECDREEIEAVESAVSKLVLAVKQTKLYPEDHVVAQHAIQELTRSMSSFTDRFGDLVLEVLKDHLRYKEHSLFEVAGSSDLAYRCYRDGVEWLIFGEGVDEAELRIFVNIVNAHQIVRDEDEGDIVTSLWNAGLSHIQYYASNAVLTTEPLLDLTQLQVHSAESRPRGEKQGGDGEDSEQEEQSALELSPGEPLWRLTQEEIEETRRRVREEENRDLAQDIFDVLLVILEHERNQEDLTIILDIFRESFATALSKGRFNGGYEFLRQFRTIRKEYLEDGHWALDYLDQFLIMVSGSRELAPLRGFLEQADKNDPEQFLSMGKMLTLLLPDSIEYLATLLPEVGSSSAGMQLREAIRRLAERDPRPLSRVVQYGEQEVAREAISVLVRVRHADLKHVLMNVARTRDPVVRKVALQGLTTHYDPDYDALLPFLGDPDPEVRRAVFLAFCRCEGAQAENSLLAFLKNRQFKRNDERLLLNSYRALGGCASDQSLPLLEERLFGSPATMGGVRSLHRRGAAEALSRMGEGKPRHLLQKAFRSLWPSIRRAERKSEEKPHAE